MTRAIVVGVGGPKSGGKGEVAKILVARHGFRTISLAETIKQMLITMGVPPRYLREDKEAEIPGFGVTGRRMMQTLGTDWGRDLIGENLWVNLWARDVERVTHEMLCDDLQPRICCDDVRFANEAAAIRALGGVTWKVLGRAEYTNEHRSEAGDFEADAIIANDGTISELEAKVEGMVGLACGWSGPQQMGRA